MHNELGLLNTSKAWDGCQMAMPLGMFARYDMISPYVHASTCHNILLLYSQVAEKKTSPTRNW